MSQVNAIPITIGGTGANTAAQARANLGISGGSPGGASLTLQFNNAGAFGGVLNSSVDPSTGDLTLGAGLTVNSIDGIYLADNSTNGALLVQAGMNSYAGLAAGPVSSYVYVSNPNASIYVGAESSGQFYSGVGDLTLAVANNSNKAIVIDATGAAIGDPTGTGPINLTSAGGMSITDTSALPIQISEEGTSDIVISQDNTGVTLTLGFNGIASLNAATAAVLGGPSSSLDLDGTVLGVATLTTIFNAVGGYQANGVPGISGSGTSMTGVTVTNGLITAATFA